MLVREFLPKNKTVFMPQQSYSSDLAHDDFILLPKLKTQMKGNRFATIEEIKEKLIQELLALPKCAFQRFFEVWKKRWHKYIISEGGYFEGDNIVIDRVRHLTFFFNYCLFREW